MERFQALEAWLAQDSHNSSKPSSSNGFLRSPEKCSLRKVRFLRERDIVGEFDFYFQIKQSQALFYLYFALAWEFANNVKLNALLLIQKGLLSELYSDLSDEFNFDQEIVKQLTDFVVLFEGITGNSQGFFASEQEQNTESAIYEWDHENTQFTYWTSDFASALERKFM